jgi:predicted extracellular nuclease
MQFSYFKKKRPNNIYTVAFYNLENLFDTKNDPLKLDDDFTPMGLKKWTYKRYSRKIKKLSKTIASLGVKGSNKFPALVGIAELENEAVIRDLITSRSLRKARYRYVHYNSPDERGIDTALLYHPKYFEVITSETIHLAVFNLDGNKDATRDILYVRGILNKEEVHVFVNHWPSRRSGEIETAYKRIKAAETIRSFMKKIELDDPVPNYLVMGDFNDGPDAESIRRLLAESTLQNPMEKLLTDNRGSANYKATWSLFDQILFSNTFLTNEKGTHRFAHANIFDEHFLKEWQGNYKGNPFRTFVGKRYLGGFSDHFPVYIQLKYQEA